MNFVFCFPLTNLLDFSFGLFLLFIPK